MGQRHLTPLAELRPDLPADVIAWAARLLAVERTERFQSAREAFGALPL